MVVESVTFCDIVQPFFIQADNPVGSSWGLRPSTRCSGQGDPASSDRYVSLRYKKRFVPHFWRVVMDRSAYRPKSGAHALKRNPPHRRALRPAGCTYPAANWDETIDRLRRKSESERGKYADVSSFPPLVVDEGSQHAAHPSREQGQQ